MRVTFDQEDVRTVLGVKKRRQVADKIASAAKSKYGELRRRKVRPREDHRRAAEILPRRSHRTVLRSPDPCNGPLPSVTAGDGRRRTLADKAVRCVA